MSSEQIEAMQEGQRRFLKTEAGVEYTKRLVIRNKEFAAVNSGDRHWTRKDPDKMQKWKNSMALGRNGGGAK